MKISDSIPLNVHTLGEDIEFVFHYNEVGTCEFLEF